MPVDPTLPPAPDETLDDIPGEDPNIEDEDLPHPALDEPPAKDPGESTAPEVRRRRGRVRQNTTAETLVIQVRDVPAWLDEKLKSIADRRRISRNDLILEVLIQRARRNRNGRYF